MTVKRILIVVPGEDDRAFYKMFVKSVADSHGLVYTDLDSGEHRAEKSRLVDEIAPQEDQQGVRLRGVSAALLRGSSGSAAVVVWPMKGEWGEGIRNAWILLSYQLGLREPTLSYFVVARDSERSSARAMLQGLLDSLAARQPCVRGSQVERGRYYMMIRSVCGKPLNLLLMAQSLEYVEDMSQVVEQHAVEDFIVYLCLDKLRRLLDKCPRLQKLVQGRWGHKKLAALAAIERCRPGVDEKFLKEIITPETVERLRSVHDGLAKLGEVLMPSP